MRTTTSALGELLEPTVNALGLDLWGLEYIPGRRHSLLRVYLDKADGVDVEDCAAASRQISDILDAEDPIGGAYTLEVSSPGLDRMLFTLEHFRDYRGERVKVKLSENRENRRNYTGVIKDVLDDSIVLATDGAERNIPFAAIAKAKVNPLETPAPQKMGAGRGAGEAGEDQGQ